MQKQRWAELCSRLGCGDAERRFSDIVDRYGESARHYHTARHIRECLDVFDEVRTLAERPDEVEFAIWLHDVVYVPRRKDNEERSADFAASCLEAQGSAEVVGRVVDLILVTRHSELPANRDQSLILDVDLHVLGAEPARYAEFEDQVRREYRWVPKSIFRRKRAEILEEFLARKPLFHNAWFQSRFEDRAKANLVRAIENLRA